MPHEATKYVWNELPLDYPIPLLQRRRVRGEKILVARMLLEKGCTVDLHSHKNEQVSIVLTGRLKFFVGQDPSEELLLGAGEVLHIPSFTFHGVETLEETDVIDLLSPPGEQGVDLQGS
jgi:quercetin dioxygenase-like cupin family protein